MASVFDSLGSETVELKLRCGGQEFVFELRPITLGFQKFIAKRYGMVKGAGSVDEDRANRVFRDLLTGKDVEGVEDNDLEVCRIVFELFTPESREELFRRVEPYQERDNGGNLVERNYHGNERLYSLAMCGGDVAHAKTAGENWLAIMQSLGAVFHAHRKNNGVAQKKTAGLSL